MPVLPHEYQMTGTSKRFLLFDSSVGSINKMFIFAANDEIEMLANSSQWFGDSFGVPSNFALRCFLKYIQFMP